MKQPDAARVSFEQALKIDPVYFPAVAALAALDLADDKPDAARQRFETILAKEPKNVPALLALAELGARSGAGKDELTKMLTDAVNADPTAARPRLLLIEHHLRNNDTRSAMTVAQAGVAAQPNSAEMVDALGRVQLAAKDYQQARTSFNKLAGMQPKSGLPHLRLAAVHLAEKDERAGRQSLNRALALTPNLLPAQQQLIALDMAAKKPQDALATARKVQQQRPSEAVGFVLEGDIQAGQRSLDGAVGAYRAALTKTPKYQSETAVKLHTLLRATNKTAEAEKFASSWIKDYPRDGRFRFHLGDLALHQRDYAGAEARYREALDINPENVLALNNVAWTMARQGKPGAVEYAEKANKLAPNQPVFMDTLAFALSEAGQHDRAIELQKQAIAAQPNAHMFKLTLANIYLKAGKKAEAEKELNELAALGDKFNSQAEVSAGASTVPTTVPPAIGAENATNWRRRYRFSRQSYSTRSR